jgi:leucyl-tRNA---protein transferase
MSFTSSLARCEYLPDRLSQIRYEVAPQLQPLDYLPRLEAGWRRFGPAMFRPECPSCAMCQSLRVPVATFRANESQRRAWKKNQGTVALRIGSPVISRERLDLWERFHQHGHHSKGWPEDIGNGPGIMLLNPFPTEEWTYYVEDRLVGVGYVDILPGALSAIYFYWDPNESARSLGTFHVLSTIAGARERELAHVYLGYYVEGCRSLEYKARFRPNEVLRGNNQWEPFVTGASPPTEVGHTVPERR